MTTSEFVYERSVYTTIRALDNKGPELCDHSVHVAIAATEIATIMKDSHLGASLPDKRDIFVAGLTHDIGKLFVDDSILAKPCGLDREEHKIMRQHTRLGFTMLLTVNELSHLAPCVLQHHERPGRKGYPLGLDTAEILPMARIISVADRFTGMLVDRPYRKAVSAEQIIPTIEEDIDAFFGCYASDVIDTLLSTDKYAIESATNQYLTTMGITHTNDNSMIVP